ncbi:MAG TPA: DUF4199 domain-containing protein [Pyrinomonadaceae bacterium]|nr:DUF4199 domain-containing protein [Pyrinomonadaceae bacterium]
MKRIVLKFGLIAGGIFVAMMVTTMPFLDQIGFKYGEIIGYTSLLVAFAFVFVGIRSYRENVGNGYITFGRAFKVGILITVIASLCYVISWQIVYYGLVPDFGDKYSQYLIEKSRAAGAGPEQIAKEVADMERFWAIYKNPVYNFLITFFVEPFPSGLLITLISAAILRKRPKEVPNGAQLVSTT